MKLEKNHWLSNAYLVFVFAVLYAPIFYLIYYSFNSGGGMNDFQSFTLEHYQAVLGDTRLIGIVIDTLVLALLSALCATIIGTLGAIMIDFIRSNRRKQFVLGMNNILLVSPDVIIGASLLILFTFIGFYNKNLYIQDCYCDESNELLNFVNSLYYISRNEYLLQFVSDKSQQKAKFDRINKIKLINN